MAYSDIQFSSFRRLRVPIDEDLRFDPKRRDVLLVRVRAIQNCRIKLQESCNHLILDGDSKVVGHLYLDDQTCIYFQYYCVVTALDEGDEEDSEKIYMILLLKSWKDKYEKVGAWRIRSPFLSKESFARELL
jgi:hypothetical protein